jgi:hypothetical protein
VTNEDQLDTDADGTGTPVIRVTTMIVFRTLG